MASSLLTFNRRLLSTTFLAAGKLRCASTRRLSYSSQEIDSHWLNIHRTITRGLVRIEPENPEPYPYGAGVFVAPTLILTSAQLVGRIATSYESKPPVEPDRFEHGHLLHRSHLPNTTVTTDRGGRTLATTPLAVNFADDLAVLKAAVPDHDVTSFPHCTVAKSPPRKGDLLLALVDIPNFHQLVVMPGNIRAKIGEKSFRVKAPWPLDNGSPWMEFDSSQFNDGHPSPSSYLFNGKNEITGSISKMIHGTPCFNSDCELIGICSWEVREEGSPYWVSFAASLLPIRAVLDYATTKKPEDPIVMDKWIQV